MDVFRLNKYFPSINCMQLSIFLARRHYFIASQNLMFCLPKTA